MPGPFMRVGLRLETLEDRRAPAAGLLDDLNDVIVPPSDLNDAMLASFSAEPIDSTLSVDWSEPRIIDGLPTTVPGETGPDDMGWLPPPITDVNDPGSQAGFPPSDPSVGDTPTPPVPSDSSPGRLDTFTSPTPTTPIPPFVIDLVSRPGNPFGRPGDRPAFVPPPPIAAPPLPPGELSQRISDLIERLQAIMVPPNGDSGHGFPCLNPSDPSDPAMSLLADLRQLSPHDWFVIRAVWREIFPSDPNFTDDLRQISNRVGQTEFGPGQPIRHVVLSHNERIELSRLWEGLRFSPALARLFMVLEGHGPGGPPLILRAMVVPFLLKSRLTPGPDESDTATAEPQREASELLANKVAELLPAVLLAPPRPANETGRRIEPTLGIDEVIDLVPPSSRPSQAASAQGDAETATTSEVTLIPIEPTAPLELVFQQAANLLTQWGGVNTEAAEAAARALLERLEMLSQAFVDRNQDDLAWAEWTIMLAMAAVIRAHHRNRRSL